jgi:hypothetical protein
VTEAVKITAGQRRRRRCRCLGRNHGYPRRSCLWSRGGRGHTPWQPVAPAMGGGRGAVGTVFGSGEQSVLEKVEGWMRESVVEIVSHIEDALFLVHLFCSDDDEGERVTVRSGRSRDAEELARRVAPVGRSKEYFFFIRIRLEG